MIRILEMEIMYSEVPPDSSKLLKNIDDFKGRLAALEEEHRKAMSEKEKDMKMKDDMLASKGKAFGEVNAARIDPGFQHAFLVKTLRDVLLGFVGQESVLRHSLAPAADETDEKKTLQTWASLIVHIRVLKDDRMETAQDTYNSTVSQLKIKNPTVELVTEGTEPFHRVIDGQVMASHLRDGSGAEESTSPDEQMVQNKEAA